jgi:hypothetical protein
MGFAGSGGEGGVMAANAGEDFAAALLAKDWGGMIAHQGG